MSELDAVRAYYASFGDREWSRLEQSDGVVEWALTTRMIARHIEPNSRVLDIGGGPGRYAIWLAQHGHTVVLADVSRELLDIARAKADAAGITLADIVEADASDLSRWGDAAFDAALSLGPFYHMPETRDGDGRPRTSWRESSGPAVTSSQPSCRALRSSRVRWHFQMNAGT